MLLDTYRNLSVSTYNPNYASIDTYDKMLLDTTVRYSYDFVRRGISSRIGNYTNADQRIEDYVNANVMPAVRRSARQMLSAIYYGASVSELIYEPFGTTIRLKRIHTTNPRNWWSTAGFRVNGDTGDVDDVEVWGVGRVPVLNQRGARQLVLYSYRSDYDNPYGVATARSIYAAWFVKSRLLQFEALGLEAFGVPPVIFKTAADGQSYIDAYQSVGANKAMSIGADDDFQVIETAFSSTGSPFGDTIRRLDGYIFNGFYIPNLVTSEGQFSTRAQANTHLDVYIMAETDILMEFVQAVILPQIIIPTLQLVYGELDNYGQITVKDPTAPQQAELSKIVKDLYDSGVFNGSLKEHLLWISDKFNLPVDEAIAKLEVGDSNGGNSDTLDGADTVGSNEEDRQQVAVAA